jgi:3-oxoacyl-[acyl-carrier protein] reductase
VIVVLSYGERRHDDPAAPVAAAPHDPAPALAAAMRRADGEAVTDIVLAPAASADDVADILDDVGTDAGRRRRVVLASAGMTASQPGELATLDQEQWRDRVERPLQRTVACFQGAHRHLRGPGGSLVVLVPTLALVGASGFAPWAAVAEGQRSLAKSAARVWGADRVTVNCVAVAAAVLVPSVRAEVSGGGAGPDRPGQPAPALAHAPGSWADVAPVVLSLLSDAWAAVTGVTVAVDGGVWMTP